MGKKKAQADASSSGDFPRGGGSTLAPLERRGAEKAAERDVLFGSQSLANDGSALKSEKNRKKKSSKKALKDDAKASEAAALDALGLTGNTASIPKYVSSLKYKALKQGCFVFGVVKEVGIREAKISLPNTLNAILPFEQVADEGIDLGDATLKDLITEGQAWNFSVVSTERVDGKNRAVVSLRTSVAHSAVVPGDLEPGRVIQGTVRSVEDHGFVIDLGVTGIRGFVATKDAGAGGKNIRAGTPAMCKVNKTIEKRGICQLSFADKSLVPLTDKDSIPASIVLPGQCFKYKVIRVVEGGAVLLLPGPFFATVDRFHFSRRDANAKPVDVGDKGTCRIIYSAASGESLVASLLPWICLGKDPTIPAYVGQQLRAKILRVDHGMGVLVQLNDSGDIGYAHASQLDDSRVEDMSKRFTVGKEVECRVMGFSLADDMYSVSMKPSALGDAIVSYEDLAPGKIVKGSIMELNSNGAVVRLGKSSGVRGFIPRNHLGDQHVKRPEQRFGEGNKVNVRVLKVEASSRRAILTAKPTLVRSTQPIWTKYDNIEKGTSSHGYVAKTTDRSAVICFYGDVHGVVTRSDLGSNDAERDAIKAGDPVVAWAVDIDPKLHRLRVSLVPLSKTSTAPPSSSKSSSDSSLHVGQIVEATVENVSEDGSATVLVSGQRCRVPSGHLCDHMMLEKVAASQLTDGDDVEVTAIILTVSSTPTVSLKPSLIRQGRTSKLPESSDDLTEGSCYSGYVRSVTSFGVFVGFAGSFAALAVKSQLADGFVGDPTQRFKQGMSVRCQVIAHDQDDGRVSVTLKPSVLDGDVSGKLSAGSFLASLVSEASSLAERAEEAEWMNKAYTGMCVNVAIEAQRDYGTVVNVTDDGPFKGVTGICVHGDVYNGKKGTKLTCVVLGCDVELGVLHLSSDESLISEFKGSTSKTLSSSWKSGTKSSKDIQGNVATTLATHGSIAYAVVNGPNFKQPVIAMTTDASWVNQTCSLKKGEIVKSVRAAVPFEPSNGTVLSPFLVQCSSATATQPANEKFVGISSTAEATVNSVLQGKVLSVGSTQANVLLGKGIKGRIHITEVKRPEECLKASQNPLSSLLQGQIISVKVLQVRSDGFVELSCRIDEDTSRISLSNLNPGQSVVGFVQGVTDDGFWVMLAPGLRGRIHVLDSSSSAEEAISIRERFHDGQVMKATVVRVDETQSVVDLTIRKGKKLSSKRARGQTAAAPSACILRAIGCGDIVPIKIRNVAAGIGLMVTLVPGVNGKVSITDVSDFAIKSPLEHFTKGQISTAKVVDFTESGDALLSMRPSDTGLDQSESDEDADAEALPLITSESDLLADQIVSGYVKASGKSGVFVTLGRSVVGRVLLKNLSDGFVKDVTKSFPVGKFVQARVISADADMGRVDLTMKASILAGGPRVKLADLKEGDILVGAVKSTQSYGLFVQIANSDLVGMAHISELSKKFVGDVSAIAATGQPVKCVVTKTDTSKNKLWLSLMPEKIEAGSWADGFSDETLVELQKASGMMEQDDAEAQTDEDEDGQQDLGVNLADLDEESSDSESEDSEGVEEEASSDADGVDEEAEESSDSEEENSESESDSDSSSMDSDDDVTDGYQWEGFAETTTTAENQDSDQDSSDESDDNDSSDESEEEGDESQRQAERKKRQRAKRSKELEVRQAEEAALHGAENPTSKDDFEKLLIENPSNSRVWVQYMAFTLSMAEIESARALAERALKSMGLADESERFNVWVALLNLENMYGTKESLMATFKKFRSQADEKKAFAAMLDIVESLAENGDDQQIELAYEIHRANTKRFPMSLKVWERFAKWRLTRSEIDQFKELMQRTLNVLPKRKHIKAATRFALLEFNHGSAERARTMMENVLSQNPRRTDLWGVYVDMEVKHGELERARALFQRIVSLPLKPRQVKMMLKRFIDFERKHGTPDGVQEVIETGRRYVQDKYGA